MRRVVLDHRTAAGDICVLTAAIKALHDSHPGEFLTDYIGHHGRTSGVNNLVANNPYITELDPDDSEFVMLDYGRGINNCGRPFHFLHGFVENLATKLGVYIELKEFRGDIWLSEEEKQPWPGLPQRYAVIDAGIKGDFTAKLWSVHRFQEVVNRTKDRITWVQIGSAQDNHKPLDNVINLIGKTSLRDLIRVIHHSALVLTPVSLPMHLAAAVPMLGDPPKVVLTLEQLHERDAMERARMPYPAIDTRRSMRPCVVLGGQREQRHWEQYPGHTYLGADGRLTCGVGVGDGCWRNKRVKIDADDSVCMKTFKDEVGEAVPECLHRVTIEECVYAVERWL